MDFRTQRLARLPVLGPSAQVSSFNAENFVLLHTSRPGWWKPVRYWLFFLSDLRMCKNQLWPYRSPEFV